jgi:NAD(P)-dependent dehydrogenase (short-subunit alcohol dehydrogenase family)
MGSQVWPDDNARKAVIKKTLIGRLGTPEDIALGAVYLASDESSFVTGSELIIDGGATAH